MDGANVAAAVQQAPQDLLAPFERDRRVAQDHRHGPEALDGLAHVALAVRREAGRAALRFEFTLNPRGLVLQLCERGDLVGDQRRICSIVRPAESTDFGPDAATWTARASEHRSPVSGPRTTRFETHDANPRATKQGKGRRFMHPSKLDRVRARDVRACNAAARRFRSTDGWSHSLAMQSQAAGAPLGADPCRSPGSCSLHEALALGLSSARRLASRTIFSSGRIVGRRECERWRPRATARAGEAGTRHAAARVRQRQRPEQHERRRRALPRRAPGDPPAEPTARDHRCRFTPSNRNPRTSLVRTPKSFRAVTCQR